MTDQDAILHPFPSLDEFSKWVRDLGADVFGKYGYTPDWSKAALMDAYALWVSEVSRWSREIKTRGQKQGTVSPSVPSHLKKAGALTSALNRTKPIRSLTRRLTYEHEPYSDFKTNIVEVYLNEYFAFEMAKNYLLVTDEHREGLAKFSDFLGQVDLHENELFSMELVNDICFFLRSRSPSSTSMYMMYRSLYATAYTWRKKFAEQS